MCVQSLSSIVVYLTNRVYNIIMKYVTAQCTKVSKFIFKFPKDQNINKFKTFK